MHGEALVRVVSSGATDEFLRSALEAERARVQQIINESNVTTATTYVTESGQRFIDGLGR
jgi:hypothetical protein